MKIVGFSLSCYRVACFPRNSRFEDGPIPVSDISVSGIEADGPFS